MKTALLLAMAGGLGAQTLAQWDNSGNAQLNGGYNFRYVVWQVANQRGDLSAALALYGTITFDGNGNYAVSCRFLSSSAAQVQTCPAITGAYRVSIGGIARIASFLQAGDVIESLVTNGVLMGSSTESSYNDLLIAAQAPADAPTEGLLKGRYSIGDFETPSSNAATFRDSLFTAAFDGSGGVESVQATGYIGSNGSNSTTQGISGLRYSFAAGVGTLAFGGTLSNTNLIAGNHSFFTSADGSFFFGGSLTGFDMMVGVKVPSGTVQPALSSGLYYQAGINSDQSVLSQNATFLTTDYSSFLSNGSFIAGHERDQYVGDVTTDSTYTSAYTLASDGTYDFPKIGFQYVVGEGGRFQLGIGKGPVIGLNLAARADFSGSGVFVNPGLILNAANFVPSTAGVSRGELITISGSGLANSSVTDGKFPTSLGGVLVLINGRAAPLFEVSPTRITAQVPFTTTELTATITVINNGQTSAPTIVYARPATPGVFLVGAKYAAALHADFTLVTPQKPAIPGETISVYVTGLGDVSPTVQAGTAAPTDPLSKVTAQLDATVGNKSATLQYIGLAPGLIGLYQLNIEIPAGVASGDALLVVATPTSFLSSALIPIAPIAGQ